MISSVTPGQLELDDLKMREWRGLLIGSVGISSEASDHLATTIYRDIIASDPADIFSLSDAISHAERFNELALFLNCIAERHLWKANALMNRAMLNLSNYMCFVYLGDACFVRLRKALPSVSTAGRCCRYLTDNPIRAFRNAIAHGNWRVSEGVIHYWARKGESSNAPLSEFSVTENDREFWFFLAVCTGKSALAALSAVYPDVAHKEGLHDIAAAVPNDSSNRNR
jgi:hypothetical protein